MRIYHSYPSSIKYTLLLAVLIIIASLTGCSTAQPAVSTPAVNTPSPSPTLSQPPATEVVEPAPPVETSPAASVPSPTPTPSPEPTQPPMPTTIYTPAAAPYIPEGDDVKLFEYMLELINNDRQSAGLDPVTLSYNAAAQQHAEDMFKNKYLAHWGTDGQKPYMRYTDAGGLNYEGENSAYTYGSGPLNPEQEIQSLQNAMMYDDAGSDWSHRDNILNKWHKKVSLGIACDNQSIALVQQFEGDYVEFFQPPAINGNILSLSGKFTQSGMVLNNIAISYDELPQPLTADQLTNGPYHSYGLGKILGQVFPPPPPGFNYGPLPTGSIVAEKGNADKSGSFYVEAEISSILDSGKGVYTICLIPTLSGQTRNMTNYSIFVK